MVFASYNAGPNRIVRLGKKAACEGLDPKQWLGNVDLVATKDVGRETVLRILLGLRADAGRSQESIIMQSKKRDVTIPAGH